jgi:hypothetical protein
VKIIRKSDYDHEGPRGNQYIAAENIPNRHLAEIMVAALNDRCPTRTTS